MGWRRNLRPSVPLLYISAVSPLISDPSDIKSMLIDTVPTREACTTTFKLTKSYSRITTLKLCRPRFPPSTSSTGSEFKSAYDAFAFRANRGSVTTPTRIAILRKRLDRPCRAACIFAVVLDWLRACAFVAPTICSRIESFQKILKKAISASPISLGTRGPPHGVRAQNG